MDSSIIICIISSLCSLVGVIITVRSSWKKTDVQTAADRAVMIERIDKLYEAVEKHNNFAIKIPVIENRLTNCEKQIDQIEKTIDKIMQGKHN